MNGTGELQPDAPVGCVGPHIAGLVEGLQAVGLDADLVGGGPQRFTRQVVHLACQARFAQRLHAEFPLPAALRAPLVLVGHVELAGQGLIGEAIAIAVHGLQGQVVAHVAGVGEKHGVERGRERFGVQHIALDATLVVVVAV